MIVVFSYVIALLGIVEYVLGRSPFSYLETIKGLYTGRFVRSGSYRIMSSCNHSLGYGLMLVTMVPFACYDRKIRASICWHSRSCYYCWGSTYFYVGRDPH